MNTAFKSEEARMFQLLRQAQDSGMSAAQLFELQRAQSDTSIRQAAILVTDDSDDMREVIVLILGSLGYENISTANNGLVALEMLRSRNFDLLVLDIEMPKLDGYGVLTALRNDPLRHHLPVIVTSGLDHLDAVVRCIELGAEDFLSKPVNSVLLRARIAASLDRKRLRDLERLRVIELQQEQQLLKTEKEKSERLLLNILPASIADRLKQGEHTIAERYPGVTVLFADLVDFSSLANRTDPEALVSMLNDLFSRFDRLADKHGVEKIKTIGDCYLVVAGMPEPRADHAQALGTMALEMLQALAELNQERGTALSLRIGLNSGPVVAGVIGHKKFTYDLWGATVNLASRMQSSGLPNRVNVSRDTRDLLEGKFHFTERGTVACKGLGDVPAFVLDGLNGKA